MPVCLNAASAIYAAVAIAAIVLTAYAGVRSEATRQRKKNIKYGENERSKYRRDHGGELKQDWVKGNLTRDPDTLADPVAKAKALSDQAKWVEQEVEKRVNRLFFDNQLRNTPVRPTNVEMVFIAALLSAVVILLQSLFPAC